MASIFSKIIAGEIPSYKIYEDEYTYAFLDISPIHTGHTLIVPKIEVDHFFEVPSPYYEAVFAAAKKIAPVLQKSFGTKRVVSAIAGFDVPHFHLHLIPGDDMSALDSSKATKASPEALKEAQDCILSHF